MLEWDVRERVRKKKLYKGGMRERVCDLLHFVVWHKTDSGKAGVILYSTQEMKRKSGGRIKRGGVRDSEQDEIIT